MPRRPHWRTGENRERFPSHVQVTAVRERQVGDTTQVIERVMIQPTSAYERPSYRLLEVTGDSLKIIAAVETLREARRRFDRMTPPELLAGSPRLLPGDRVETSADKWRGYARARKIPRQESCDRCGTSGIIDRHHKDGNQLNNDPSNIAFLCRRCHKHAHSRPDVAERCPKGHPRTPENFAISGGRMFCRACHREYQRAYTARRKKTEASA